MIVSLRNRNRCDEGWLCRIFACTCTTRQYDFTNSSGSGFRWPGTFCHPYTFQGWILWCSKATTCVVVDRARQVLDSRVISCDRVRRLRGCHLRRLAMRIYRTGIVWVCDFYLCLRLMSLMERSTDIASALASPKFPGRRQSCVSTIGKIKCFSKFSATFGARLSCAE